MSINEVRYLPECGSTNAYMKEHFEEFGPVGAVYTTNQTAGRGRLGRTWVNAEGKALYYTVAIREPLAQPATLPLLASLAVRRQLALRYGEGRIIVNEPDKGADGDTLHATESVCPVCKIRRALFTSTASGPFTARMYSNSSCQCHATE